MHPPDLQAEIREDIFRWLTDKRASGIEEISRAELAGYRFGELEIPLVDRNRGIRNPVDFDATLSILHSADGPYDDLDGGDGLLHYAYREGDPRTGDNRKLRRAMELRVPIIYFERVRPNFYVPVFPSYVVGDDPQRRTFAIALDESLTFLPSPLTDDTRSYAERVVWQRLHQPMFRARVINAYERSCTVCRLKHPDLLDAAHILPDSSATGIPVVSNGLALCKIHHAAYDRNLMGITPDFQVRINGELLREIDGPMLRHGLQDMHGTAITLPRRRQERPSQDALAARFAEFIA
jgi:Predicted restriction endonuclease